MILSEARISWIPRASPTVQTKRFESFDTAFSRAFPRAEKPPVRLTTQRSAARGA
jgi:hypothetical protein